MRAATCRITVGQAFLSSGITGFTQSRIQTERDRSGTGDRSLRPRLRFVEHQDVLGLLTLRRGPFGFQGQRLAVFGHRTAAGFDRLARLLQYVLGRVAVDLLDRDTV